LARLAAQKKATAPKLGFGPVVERVIQARQTGTNLFLDLDTGRLLTPPANVTESLGGNDRNWQALDIPEDSRPFHYIQWLRESGADLMFSGADELIGFDGMFPYAHGSNSTNWESWDDLTPAQVQIDVGVLEWGRKVNQAKLRNQPWPEAPQQGGIIHSAIQMDSQSSGGPTVNLLTLKQSALWFFKTREGGMGLLQITGFTDNPRGVKLRYKLVNYGGSQKMDFPMRPRADKPAGGPGVIDPATGLPVAVGATTTGSHSNELQAAVETWSPDLAPGEKPDVSKIWNDAKDLMEQGKYEEALQRHLWYFNHALEYDQGQTGVRLSFALSQWVELGRRYPKAKQALLEIRDHDAQLLASGQGYVQLFSDVNSINNYLGQDDATLALFKTMYQNDPKLAGECFYYAEDLLLKKGEYELLLKCVGDPQAHFESARRGFQVQIQSQQRMAEMRKKHPAPQLPAGAFRPPDMGQMATNNFVGQVRKLVEILVATDHKADAEKIQSQALAVLDDARLESAVSDAEKKIGGRPVQNGSAPKTNSVAIRTNRTYSSFDQPSAMTPDENLPSGAINFQNVSLSQVLKVYEAVSGRTVVQGTLPAVNINLRSATPLTRIQTLQLFDTVLAANGIAMVLSGENAVKAVPVATATAENPPEINLPWEMLPDSSSPMSRTIQLKNLKAVEVVPMLTPLSKLPNSIVVIQDRNLLILRDYASSIRQQLKLVETLEQKQTGKQANEVLPGN
jgi:tetratricopeptide (TPR) repeat protein